MHAPDVTTRATGVNEQPLQCTNPECRRWYRACNSVEASRCPYCGSNPRPAALPASLQSSPT